jgi:hypothetical protein
MKKLNDISEADRESRLQQLFANNPIESEILVEPPSKGRFYTGYSGLKVIPLLFEDEQKILLSKNRNRAPVNEILSKCVQGVNISELLDMDKVFLLLKIKEISYGPDYSFNVICPACEGNTDVTVDVSKHLAVKYAEDTLTDPREVELPILKVKAVVKFPRVRDEAYFEEVETAIKNMYRFVVSLDGIEDPVFIAKALEKMHIRDLKTLTKEIHRKEYGLDTTINFECPHCGANTPMGVPLDARFFSVT